MKGESLTGRKRSKVRIEEGCETDTRDRPEKAKKTPKKT
jgi:hypothetical protein